MGVELKFHIFLTSPLAGGHKSASRFDKLYPVEREHANPWNEIGWATQILRQIIPACREPNAGRPLTLLSELSHILQYTRWTH